MGSTEYEQQCASVPQETCTTVYETVCETAGKTDNLVDKIMKLLNPEIDAATAAAKSARLSRVNLARLCQARVARQCLSNSAARCQGRFARGRPSARVPSSPRSLPPSSLE